MEESPIASAIHFFSPLLNASIILLLSIFKGGKEYWDLDPLKFLQFDVVVFLVQLSCRFDADVYSGLVKIIKVPFWQKWKIAVHEIQNFFWPKVFFWSIKKVPFRKNIYNMPQGPPNSGFMQGKVQKGDFLKNPSGELRFFFLVLGSYESLEGLES